MFERPEQQKEAALLVQVNFPGIEAQEALDEFRELAVAAGANPLSAITGSRQVPDAKYFVGAGKAAEIQAAVAASNATLVLFNHPLSPGQQRNLERLIGCRVLDRTGLILDIFAQRARTFEGKLQVELAQLQHLATHLVRGWTHLERQRGGIGLRGPGETQLETDRRLIRKRIQHITQRLEKVRKQREQGRRSRRRSELTTVSLVGYTNAGKSTLFNQLTQAGVYVADQLFATLDPTLRRIKLADGRPTILADTVGFIRQLPHDLVEAFRATLQETQEANLLLHVIDVQSKTKDEQINQVNDVLTQIEANHVPQLLVYNKIDRLSDTPPRLERNANGKPWRVWVSAVTGAGIDLLLQALTECLQESMVDRQVCLSPSEGRLRAMLYDLGAVEAEQIDEQGQWLLQVHLSQADYARLFGEK